MIIDSIFIILFLIFIGAFIFSFFLIVKQVALVKKGEFKIKDRLQCLIYAFIFSSAILVVVGMGFIFSLETPEFWEKSNQSAPFFNPLYLLIPFIICLAYISFYPLIDFLFIALSGKSDEGLTPFHKFIGEKIINKTNSKFIHVLFALSLYTGIFLVPPLLISLLGVPFLFIWITWMLIYPLMILIFYGSRGYIAGISNSYFHIPDIKRTIFLGFEDGKRTLEEFKKGWVPRVLMGLMLFVFVWAWISMIQTINFYFSRTLPFAFIMSSLFIFVTLFFGVLGYFSRFWNRKITYRGIDIYFAAYLMAAIGINVLVNFLLVNYNKLTFTFNSWEFTNDIIPNYYLFALPAAIEEIFLIFFISYYFLAQNNKFTKNLKYSKITECGQKFDPIPLFNFIKSRDQNIKKHAEQTLITMYERIPVKDANKLNDINYKYPLIDGLSDPNPYSRAICFHILLQLQNDIPDVILPWIIESLNSPNYEKKYSFVQALFFLEIKVLEKIPFKMILNLINEPEWRLKILGLKLLSRIIKNDNAIISKLNLKLLLNNPENKIQVELINLFSKISFKISDDIIIEKLNNHNQYVREAMLNYIKNQSFENKSPNLIKLLKKLISDPYSNVRSFIFEIFAEIGNFREFNISINPLLEGLTDLNQKVRNAAILALEKYLIEEEKSLDIDIIINRIDPNNYEITSSVLSLLGRLWERNPKKILEIFLIFIKFDNKQLKEKISELLINKSDKYSELIINNLIKIPDTSKFVAKGIISRTLIKIAEYDPKIIIPKLIKFLDTDDEDAKLNTIITLEGLTEKYPQLIEIKPIMSCLKKDINQKVKKEAFKIIVKLAEKSPSDIEPELLNILETFNAQDKSVKINFSKSLIDIAKANPSIIPIEAPLSFLRDNDSFIRESGALILGFIGHKVPIDSINVLFTSGLNDDDWIVREASISSLGKIIDHIDDKKEIIEKIITFLNDEKAWVRRSAINILTGIDSINPLMIPLELIKNNVNHIDSNVRESSANLLRIYGLHDINKVLELMIQLLEDKSEDVRTNMINEFIIVINKIGLSKILSNLLKNLGGESSIELQRSIALLLERTAKYESEEIKKRVISLLKIRCEITQDPIICESLHKIKEN